MENFSASVQYGDWRGTAASDNADNNDFRDLLIERGAMDPDSEFLISVKLWVGENTGGKVEAPYIEALVYDGTHADNIAVALKAQNDPIPVKQVNVELTLNDFIALYKRFSIALNHRAFDLDDRTYVATTEVTV